MPEEQPVSYERTAPSGRQFRIAQGQQEVVVTEVGATLRLYRAGDREVLDGFNAGEICSGGRGQPLLPWPNRIRDGRYRFNGADHQLPLTEPERGNAIHGLVRWTSWQAEDHSDHRVVMRHTLHPQPGYPFTLLLSIEYELSADGLSVTMRALNSGIDPCPFGAGAHPYLSAGAGGVDSTTLRLPGRERLLADDRGIPTGRESVAGTEFDFLEPKGVGGTVLDTAYADLQTGAGGRFNAVVTGADGRSTTLWADQGYPYLMVFTGDTLSGPERRRGIALEPMTCPPNAFQSGEGLRVLQPGQEFEASWGITPPG